MIDICRSKKWTKAILDLLKIKHSIQQIVILYKAAFEIVWK